ncbi:J domain-containing protein [Aestuariivirga sp.]|uniref:J domain-containing protein n=1 Tax=Aestuariivirga sp. TaxID=2650926 RepID=UPI0039E293B5
MFSNAENKISRALIAIMLNDGSTSTVSVKLPLSGKLSEAINNADHFIDVMDSDNRQAFISKHAIRRVDLIDVPKINQLNQQRRTTDKNHFDPYAVLGVERGASPEAIRAAYHQQAKRYHPDRMATLDLPKEMTDYAAAMLVRINLAYEQIGG